MVAGVVIVDVGSGSNEGGGGGQGNTDDVCCTGLNRWMAEVEVDGPVSLIEPLVNQIKRCDNKVELDMHALER